MNASDLTELLQMLQGTQKNWVAHIALPEAVAIGSGEPWQAQLTVIEGKVTCQVWSSVDKRVLLTNDRAIRWLATLPRLSWTLELIESTKGIHTCITGIAGDPGATGAETHHTRGEEDDEHLVSQTEAGLRIGRWEQDERTHCYDVAATTHGWLRRSSMTCRR